MKRQSEKNVVGDTRKYRLYRREEWEVYDDMIWYEQIRLIYIFKGLMEGHLVIDLVRRILEEFMSLLCSHENKCGHLGGVITERIYRYQSGRLFSEIYPIYRTMHENKVNYTKYYLHRECGVPMNRIFIIAYNDNPMDGRGQIFPYRENFMDKDFYRSICCFPPRISYTCVDINSLSQIRHFLNDTVLPDQEIIILRGEIDNFCLIQ
jgi:hypothetical protein